MRRRHPFCFALFLFLILAMGAAHAMQIVDEQEVSESSSDPNIAKTLRGDFVSFDGQGVLRSSVGTFSIPSYVRVTDRRIQGQRDAKVSIR